MSLLATRPFSFWYQSYIRASRSYRSYHSEILYAVQGSIQIMLLWFTATVFFEYCTPVLARNLPNYPNFLWGCFALCVLLVQVPAVLRRVDRTERPTLFYAQRIGMFLVFNAIIVCVVGWTAGYLIAKFKITSTYLFFMLLSLGSLVGSVMGFFLPAWSFRDITWLCALKQAVLALGKEWPAILAVGAPYLPLAFVGQWVPSLLQVGYFTWVPPLCAKYVPLLAQSIWLLVGNALFIVIYDRYLAESSD